MVRTVGTKCDVSIESYEQRSRTREGTISRDVLVAVQSVSRKRKGNMRAEWPGMKGNECERKARKAESRPVNFDQSRNGKIKEHLVGSKSARAPR
jgi:hypothetical protein